LTRLGTLPAMREQSLFGLDFVTDSSTAEVVETLLGTASTQSERWRCVVTPNVDHLVRYDRNPSERRVAETAYLLLPDGLPIIWASRLLKRPLSGRVTGSDLFPVLWRRLVDERRPIIVVAGNRLVADKLSAEHPGATMIVPPLFDVDDGVSIGQIADQVVQCLAQSSSDFVMIGLSMEKHHALAAELMTRQAPPAGAPVLLLLGASAEFYVGVQDRAPQWMRSVGMEWLHRLAKNPRGMAKRYLVDDVAFVRTVWRDRHSPRGNA
jgi:N-acetylglucosaminyldiphosphoundecaprenol N-acetyl-beta-D-mannosaminyltransferase